MKCDATTKIYRALGVKIDQANINEDINYRAKHDDMLCDDAANDKNINSICYNCSRYNGECRGTSEQAYTGCIYREVR